MVDLIHAIECLLPYIATSALYKLHIIIMIKAPCGGNIALILSKQ